jgi:hypothetical protein
MSQTKFTKTKKIGHCDLNWVSYKTYNHIHICINATANSVMLPLYLRLYFHNNILKSNKILYSIMVSSSQRNFPSAHLITVQINTVTELLDTYGDKVWRGKPGFKT